MKTKVLQVFYNENGLPFKDQERTVHFPVIGSGFMGASNTTQIKFYFKEIGDDAVKYVAVSKLPNGKVGSKVLENYYDSELDEPYALLELDSYYTQYKGDLFISLQGYQGGVQVNYDEDTELYEIEGTPTIQATGSIKFTNNYATQFVGSGEEQNITLQQLLAIISDTVLRYYVTSSNTLAEVFNEIGTKICAIDIEGDEYLCEMSGDTNIVIYDIHNQEWYAFTGANTTTIDEVMSSDNKQIIATKEDLENFGNLFTYKGTASVSEINALTDIGNGWCYNLTDSGTLTLGNLQVETGDNVAFDGSVWTKLSSETVLGNYYTKQEGQEFETQVDNRVDAIENQVQQVASGSPKGVYATLEDLQTAYPTGTTGIYVVSADGHWYYWNGSAWTDGGVYLSTGDAASKDAVDSILRYSRFYPILESDFESGTLYQNGNTIAYTSAPANIRYKQSLGSFYLKAGTIIQCSNEYKIRLIKVNSGNVQTLINYDNKNFLIQNSGNYTLVLGTEDASTITDINDALSNLYFINTTSKDYKDILDLKQNSPQIFLDENSFEKGTAYEVSGAVNYQNSTNVVRVSTFKKHIELKKDNVVVLSNDIEARILKDGATVSTIFNFGSVFQSFVIPEDGNYILAIRYKDLHDITDIAELLSKVSIYNSKYVPIYRNVLSLEKNNYCYLLKDNQFELGTVYVLNSNIQYQNDNTIMRLKQNTFIHLSANSVVIPLDNVKIRVIKKVGSTYTQMTNYTTGRYLIEEDGDYCFAIGYTDSRTITNVEEVLNDLIIENGSNIAVKDIYNLQNKAKLDNTPKKLFGIMTYNCGRWYNGSGQIVPEADFNTYLDIQKHIVDDYMPDVLCLQEYSSLISNNRDAKIYLLDHEYFNIASAKENTTYDGKSICTSRTLTNATNIEFVNNDGNVRNYEKAYILFNGIKICVVSTHFSIYENVISLEIGELIAALSNEENVIICADTNIDASDSSSTSYIATLKQFVDAGYTLVNTGEFKTCDTRAIDNIIFKGNIKISHTVVDTYKKDILSSSDVDHLPLITYFELDF